MMVLKFDSNDGMFFIVIGSLNFALYFCCNTAFVCR